MTKVRLWAALLTACTLAAACSSSSKPTSSAGLPTYKIGVITSLTGIASGSNGNIMYAIKAGDLLARDEGFNLQYDVVDDMSSPSGVLAAAQRLVEEDHVLAVIAISDLTFAAAPYLAQHGIPVIGGAVDSTEWTNDSNMFSILGYPDYTKVTTTVGRFFKLVGATDVGAVGYGIVPSAATSAKATALSAEAAGLQSTYTDANFPLGSTNVGPTVLAIKASHVDGLNILVQHNTAFAILSALREDGVDLKAPLLSDGYGQSLIQAGPGAVAAAQNDYFELEWEPVQMHTAATQKFQKYLHEAGFDGVPGLAEYLAYTSFDALVKGLRAAGSNPTHTSIIHAMLEINAYDGAGLFGGHTISFEMAQRGLGSAGAGNCNWMTLFKGTTFNLVPGADPVCGSVIPGKTVSASS